MGTLKKELAELQEELAEAHKQVTMRAKFVILLFESLFD